jgi:putative acetyltransferase
VIVRVESPDDHAAIRFVVDEAFGDTITGDIVDAIRTTDRFVPALSLVAVSEGQTIGHVISSYVDVVTVPGTRRVLQVGPLAVRPAHQRRGVGTALMHETIRIADELGEPALLIEGNPAYYGRFGFTRADEHGIEMPPESHGPQYFMIRPLAAYRSLRGRAVYPPETFGVGY